MPDDRPRRRRERSGGSSESRSSGGDGRDRRGGGRDRREHGSERRDHGRGSGRSARSERSAPVESRKTIITSAGQIPAWVSEDIARTTPRAQVRPATEALAAAAEAFVAGRHGKALALAREAKSLAPRVASVRELIGLAAYRTSKWEDALRELRTYRRMSGDTSHLPIEMDVLRALDRPDDVDKAWEALARMGGDKDTMSEARVVYASSLLDRGDAKGAWRVIGPKRAAPQPLERDLREWFVAARAAARLDDLDTARRLYERVQQADPAFPGLDDLDRITSGRD